jgi:hypothetical protein
MTQNNEGRCQEWEKEYQKFINGEDPHKSYIEHLEEKRCPFCNAAIEREFDRTSRALEELGRVIRKGMKDPT